MPVARVRRDARRVNKRGETWDQTVSRVHAQFPSTAEGRDWWYERLAYVDPDERPGLDQDFAVMGALLHDIINVDLIMRSGEVRRGSRPPLDYIEGMAQLRKLRGMDFTTLAFPEAFRLLGGGRSQRHLAVKTGLSKDQVHRLLNGAIAPSGDEMERIASSFDKNPTYFREYRTAIVCALTARLLEDEPERSVAIVRKLTAPR